MNAITNVSHKHVASPDLGLKIERRKISEIKPAKRSARNHSKKKINNLSAGIERYGYIDPIIIDENDRVIAGHARLAAAKKIGMDWIEVIKISHLSETEKKAFAIFNNRIAELSEWDFGVLKLEYDDIEADPVTRLDIPLLGFTEMEINQFDIGDTKETQDVEEEALPVVDRSQVVTLPDDIWLIGKDHRLGCGDVRDQQLVRKVMNGELADCVFTDPPYNVAIDRNVCGSGKIRHSEFMMASGELSPALFEAFLQDGLGLLASFSRDGSIHFVCMDWRHLHELYSVARHVYHEQKNLICWNKTNAGMGSFYRSQHELIAVYKRGKGKHTNNFGLGETGRYRTNVWTYAGVNSFGPNQNDLALHPTVKPTALVVDALLDVTHRGQIVLDGFAGSGTTLIAAEKIRRRARLIELDPYYCDIICKRAFNVLGLEARLESTGETFEEVQRQRLTTNQ